METIVKEPNLYDLLYKDVTEDIKLYSNLTKNYSEIIEYGAGTGRITIPLALDGKTVYAIDNEQKMLDKLKENMDNSVINYKNNIKIINSDMKKYKHYKPAECIIMPLTVFNYLLTDEEQKECINNISASLKSGGKLVMELLTMKTFQEINTSEEYQFIKKIEIENGYYEYWRKTKLENNIMQQNRMFKLFDNDKNFISKKQIFWKNRFVSKEEISALLNKYNLKILNIYGNCSMNKFNYDSEDMFIEAIKS